MTKILQFDKFGKTNFFFKYLKIFFLKKQVQKNYFRMYQNPNLIMTNS